jgi:hypothetical protein
MLENMDDDLSAALIEKEGHGADAEKKDMLSAVRKSLSTWKTSKQVDDFEASKGGKGETTRGQYESRKSLKEQILESGNKPPKRGTLGKNDPTRKSQLTPVE